MSIELATVLMVYEQGRFVAKVSLGRFSWVPLAMLGRREWPE
jgi:hypothetical protein